MNIFEKIYILLLIIIIIFLSILYIQTKRINDSITSFTGWIETNYNPPYEENNIEK